MNSWRFLLFGVVSTLFAVGTARCQAPASRTDWSQGQGSPAGYRSPSSEHGTTAGESGEWISDLNSTGRSAKPIRRLPRQTQAESADRRGANPSQSAGHPETSSSSLPFAHLIGLPQTPPKNREHSHSPPRTANHGSNNGPNAARADVRAIPRRLLDSRPQSRTSATATAAESPTDDARNASSSSFARWFRDSFGTTGKAKQQNARVNVNALPAPAASTATAAIARLDERPSNDRAAQAETSSTPADKNSEMEALFDVKLLTGESDLQPAAPETRQAGLSESRVSAPKPVAAAFTDVLSDKAEPSTPHAEPAPAIASKQPSNPSRIPLHAQAGSDQVNQAIATDPLASNPFHRPKIIFQPVVGGVDSRGNALLRPDVQLSVDDVIAGDPGSVRMAQFTGDDAALPPPANFAPETAYPVDDEWMPPVVAGECGPNCNCNGCAKYREVPEVYCAPRGHHCLDDGSFNGIGREYVMNAPFFVDTTQPFNNCRVRTDYAFDWEFPDRAEYFWSKTPGPKGPGDPENRGEESVDYQEISFYIERGWERFSVGTSIPIRAIDPVYRLNTTGLADMEVTSKLVFLDGCRWQLTQLFSTHINTGSFRRGTGNGHVSLEPGFAWRYKWSDITYIHGDLTYWFPIAADPFHSGQVLNHGIAVSHVWIDADDWAIIPTFEVDAWTVLDGNQTLPGTLLPDLNDPRNFEEIDSLSIINLYPGLRWVCDKGGDCSVKEFGISAGASVTEDHWYRGILRLEFRWSR